MLILHISNVSLPVLWVPGCPRMLSCIRGNYRLCCVEGCTSHQYPMCLHTLTSWPHYLRLPGLGLIVNIMSISSINILHHSDPHHKNRSDRFTRFCSNKSQGIPQFPEEEAGTGINGQPLDGVMVLYVLTTRTLLSGSPYGTLHSAPYESHKSISVSYLSFLLNCQLHSFWLP